MTIRTILPKDEAAWHKARSKDVTASVAGALLGVHEYVTAYSLWAEKTGRVSRDLEETKPMQRGRLLEPVAIDLLREERPNWTIDYKNDRAYTRDTDLRIGCTPDAFGYRDDIQGRGVIQVKTVSRPAFRTKWVDPDTGDVVPPLWIAVQTLIEAKLTGAAWATIAPLVVGEGTLDLEPIDMPIHDGVWKRIKRAVAEFWAIVESGEEMDPDWGRDGRTIMRVFEESEPDRIDLTGVAGVDALIDEYQRAGEAIRDATALRDELKPQLIYALGNAECGETERFDITASTQRRPGHVVKATTTRVLRIKPKKESYDGSF
ncbi:YqaJ viral recombinase family protein [Aurantimonas sp. DM33-3]|uniref:YqaJ viral recombinase family nuclease n=1 Tax=Aurantimonas sp. DM33-3 TaxID=2766955 RepID=UPI00165271F4|nr:YqaJ viral recombinase family protein [Aurantimonas sp. DM33-3]MBC6714733.1 YqaJ viral recombinase family protein [Aurantimonas sp. DM33-3]